MRQQGVEPDDITYSAVISACEKGKQPKQALNALAAMWLNGNQIQYCKAYLEQVEEIAPNEPEVILTKARLYQATEKYAEAQKLKEHLLNLKGCFGRVRRMARAYLR